MKLNTGGYGIPHQPTVPPMQLSKTDIERKFINEVITLATTYGLNCYVRTDNMYGNINCHDTTNQTEKSDVEINNTSDMKAYEPERTEYINGMKDYLNKLKENNKKQYE